MDTFDTYAQAQAATVAASVQSIFLTGYYKAGDAPPASYFRVSSQPATAAQLRTADRFLPSGSTDPTNGGYWQLVITGGVVNVDWLGARPVPLKTPAGYAPAGSVPDSSNAIQNAINALHATGGGTLQFGRGVYGVGNGISVTFNDIYLRGAGPNATILLHAPAFPSSAVVFGNAGQLFNTGIYDMAVTSADTTTLKIGITAIDVSQWNCKNVIVRRYVNPPGNDILTATSQTAVGLQTQGRDLSVVEDCQFYANIPINIAPNSRVVGGSEDLDSWTFRDLTLISDLTGATKNVIQCDVYALNNVKFTGHQNWIGGVDGFHWTSGQASISIGLFLEGIKSEQASPNTGYTVNITNSASLFSFALRGMSGGDRQGIKLRGIPNGVLEGVMFDHNAGGTVGLDIDGSCRILNIKDCIWIAGTTASIVGLTATNPIFLSGSSFSTAIPVNVTYNS
jgi:hypothetical protein